jgi:hypothetical protein
MGDGEERPGGHHTLHKSAAALQQRSHHSPPFPHSKSYGADPITFEEVCRPPEQLPVAPITCIS